jgi:Domain of unknown function (DUF5134)
MAADPMRQRSLDEVLVVVFVIATAAIAAVTVLLYRRERRLNQLWVVAGIDTAAMSYMAAAMASSSTVLVPVTWIVVAYLGCETFAWLLGLWDRAPAQARSSLGLSGRIGLDIRLTLAVMTASMAYMLIAMAA